MLGMKNYNPKFYTNSADIVKELKNNLESLKGETIKEIWIVWEQTSNQWFNQCPVVICFENSQIELCAYKTDEYVITFNQICISDEIDWYGTELELKWEKISWNPLTL